MNKRFYSIIAEGVELVIPKSLTHSEYLILSEAFKSMDCGISISLDEIEEVKFNEYRLACRYITKLIQLGEFTLDELVDCTKVMNSGDWVIIKLPRPIHKSKSDQIRQSIISEITSRKIPEEFIKEDE